MKKALAILVVIAFVAALSSAATYQPSKDTFYRYDSNLDGQGAGNDTFGGATDQRANKGWQDGFFMDFDRATILADITTALGRAPVAADFTDGTVAVTLALTGNTAEGSLVGANFTPQYWTSTTPWTEGGATFKFADRATSTPWNTTGASMRDCPVAAAGTTQAWAAADFQYNTFAIDANVASGFLFSEAAGVALQMRGDSWFNGHVFAKEGTVTLFGQTNYAGPVLGVTVVPEPCSMLLIAAGAAAMIRRRK